MLTSILVSGFWSFSLIFSLVAVRLWGTLSLLSLSFFHSKSSYLIYFTSNTKTIKLPGTFLSSLNLSITFSRIRFLANPSTPCGSIAIFRRHVGHFTSGSKWDLYSPPRFSLTHLAHSFGAPWGSKIFRAHGVHKLCEHGRTTGLWKSSRQTGHVNSSSIAKERCLREQCGGYCFQMRQ